MFTLFDKEWARPLVCFAAMSIAPVASANALAKETQNKLSEWISLEKQISEDESEWAAQKEVLRNSIGFMNAELTRLQEAIETAEETASAGERKRAELQERKDKLNAATDAMSKSIEEYETSIRAISKGWPKAFLKQIETPLKRMPIAETKEKDIPPLTMRMQNIVVILSQFDKFQSLLTKEIEVQTLEGSPREVTTLYYGFAYAYFVDGSGAYAGVGYPDGNAGWMWTPQPELAPKIQDLVAIYDRSTDARFIGLPAKIMTP